jgi:hypothetical protein
VPESNPIFDEILSAYPDWRAELFLEIWAAINEAEPRLEEQVKWRMPSKPWGAAVWFLDGNVIVVDFLKDALRLTFPKGALLANRTDLFNARLTSKDARAIDFHRDEEIDWAMFESLVKSAAWRLES